MHAKRLPLDVRSLQWFFGSRVARRLPGLASWLAFRLWFRTRRYPTPKIELDWMRRATLRRIPWRKHSLQIYEWGEGPLCLLLHGWNGRATQLGGLAETLAINGFRALAVDLPAHGLTPGGQTHIFEMVDAIRQLEEQHPPFHAVIGHSFGNVPLAYLLREGLRVERAVFISPPDEMHTLFDYYCRLMHISSEVRAGITRRVDRRLGSGVWADASPLRNVRQLSTKGLVIHDRDDRELPWQIGEAVAKAWPGAAFSATEGLGHRRLLRDPAVLKQVCDFIS